MRTKQLAIAAAPIVMTVFLTPQVFAIMCYQCNSKTKPECADVLLLNRSDFYKECEEWDDSKPFCRKTIITVLAAKDGKAESRVVRSCGRLRSPSDCEQRDDDDHNELVCQCFSDGCNGAPPPAAAAPPRAALLGASLAAAALPLALLS